MQEFCRTG